MSRRRRFTDVVGGRVVSAWVVLTVLAVLLLAAPKPFRGGRCAARQQQPGDQYKQYK
ncbi:MAG: hypothetical protein R3E31_11780 [Chloroflexota bacterium]